jgi:mercuric ion transport protein
MKIQLLYFPGCPNLEPARAALRDALAAEGLAVDFDEIDVAASDAPQWARGWGSPTILIDGNELTGATRSSGAACRLYKGGAPSVDEIRSRIGAARRVPPSSSGRVTLSILGAITAAMAASACCLVPAILAAVGLSSAGLGARLAPYRVHFLITTGIALGIGFWLVYRKAKDACGCEVPRTRRAARLALWCTTVLVVGLSAYPLLRGRAASAGSAAAPAAATLRLAVTGMDCAECTGMIANRLTKVPGVVSATVDFKSGLAIVRHDGRDGIAAAAIAAVVDAGFAATVAP